MEVLTVLLMIAFWLSAIAVVTPYLIYPFMLRILASVRRERPVGTSSPTVSLVISAYNEASIIGEKLHNVASLDYPDELLDVVVISDESDDGTDEIVKTFTERSVRLFRQSPREGKSAALTRFVPECTGEVIVFSDANSMYDAAAVRNLVRHFDDPTVGYVVGHQRYQEGDGAASQSESTYWGFEVGLKALESRLSSVVGGDGAIMAMRRELFTPLRKDDINDFLIPLRIVVAGYRGVFDPQAFCYEEAAPDFAGEFRRKVRIVNRSFRALGRAPAALNPFKVGVFTWQLLCHKVVRWLTPVFMLVCFLTSLILAIQGSWFFQAMLAVQICFYLVAAARWIPGLRDLKIVYLCYYFCLSNLAAGLGIMNILVGKNFSTWTPQRLPTQTEA